MKIDRNERGRTATADTDMKAKFIATWIEYPISICTVPPIKLPANQRIEGSFDFDGIEGSMSGDKCSLGITIAGVLYQQPIPPEGALEIWRDDDA